jgi:hypothetical protein
VGAGDRHLCSGLLQEGKIKERIDNHPGAARKDSAFFEAKKLLVKVAKFLGFLGDKRDVS